MGLISVVLFYFLLVVVAFFLEIFARAHHQRYSYLAEGIVKRDIFVQAGNYY